MFTYKCPKGHESSESDYCSECGTKINGTPELARVTNSVTSTVRQTTATQAVQTCPDCTAPHEPNSGDFCEICGYNFISGAHGEVPPVSITPAPVAGTTNQSTTKGAGISALAFDPQPSSSAPVGAGKATLVTLELIATIDPSLREAGSPEPPINQAPIAFRLDKETHLIGRSNERRGIHPEVALDFDDAVSHRHALLIRQPDGTFIVRDINSTNGTKLNGVELAAMVDTPIKEGDEFTLGHWTRIIVKAAHRQEEQI